jgi:hypothetical protein
MLGRAPLLHLDLSGCLSWRLDYNPLFITLRHIKCGLRIMPIVRGRRRVLSPAAAFSVRGACISSGKLFRGPVELRSRHGAPERYVRASLLPARTIPPPHQVIFIAITIRTTAATATKLCAATTVCDVPSRRACSIRRLVSKSFTQIGRIDALFGCGMVAFSVY